MAKGFDYLVKKNECAIKQLAADSPAALLKIFREKISLFEEKICGNERALQAPETDVFWEGAVG